MLNCRTNIRTGLSDEDSADVSSYRHIRGLPASSVRDISEMENKDFFHLAHFIVDDVNVHKHYPLEFHAHSVTRAVEVQVWRKMGDMQVELILSVLNICIVLNCPYFGETVPLL